MSEEGYMHGQDGEQLGDGLGQAGRGAAEEPMSADEATAYLADHPRFAAQVDQRGRELAERYGQGVDVATDRVGELFEPELMVFYQHNRQEGMDPAEAMARANRDLASVAWELFLPQSPSPPLRVVPGPLTVQRQRPELEGASNSELYDTAETIEAWNAARVWVPHDAEAAHAMASIEAHLRRLQPAAMAVYDLRRAAGLDWLPAMAGAVHLFERDPWLDEMPALPPALDPAVDPPATPAVTVLSGGPTTTPPPDPPGRSLAPLSYPSPVHLAPAPSQTTPTGGADLAPGARGMDPWQGRQR